MQAYTLPATFAQAKAEHDYWTDRNQELEDAFSDDGDLPGNNELDLPTEIRARSSVPLPSTSSRSPHLPTFTRASRCIGRASPKTKKSRARSSATSAPWLFVRPRCPMWTRPQHPHSSTRLDGSKASSRLTRNGRTAGLPVLAGARQRRSAGSGTRLAPRAQTDPSNEVDRSTRSMSAQPLQSPRLLDAMVEGQATPICGRRDSSNWNDPAA